MKKLVFAFLFIIFLAFSPQSFAKVDNMTFSWTDRQTIQVSSYLNGTLTKSLSSDDFSGRVSGSRKCNNLTVKVDTSANTATVYNPTTIGNGSIKECGVPTLGFAGTYDISNPYPDTNAGETQQQKRVDITLRSPKKSDQSPDNVIITVKDSAGTIKTAPNVGKNCTTGDCSTGAVEYKTNINLEPGIYNVCFSSFEPCHDFEKKIREQLNLYYGESSLGREINVLIETHDKITTGSPYSVSPYAIELKKDGTVVNKCTTNEVKQPPLPGEADAIGSKKDITVSQRCSMDDVGEGKYQICKTTGSLECKDIEKKAGTPLSVNFKVEACGIGLNSKAEDCAPAEKNPDPAPPPPCATENEIPCKSFKTPFGNIPTNAAKFISATFGIILSVSGGIALLLIMRAGYKIMMSQGNQEAIKEGRDQLIAALVGLMFLIFSFVFLQLLGADILKIPGFSGQDTSPDPQSSQPVQPVQPEQPTYPDISGCSGQTLSSGANTDCVKTLQHYLNITEDGAFGPQTAQAVVDYQTNMGLVIDGVAGPCTWTALKGEPIPDSCKRP